MGITGLWDVLGQGERVSIAEYSARHFERCKRPLRIAVDEAGWRFNNLNPEQVQRIREEEPAANPVEKNILWRILRLLRLNIQLIFVFDGNHRPWKRNRRGGNRIDHERVRLLTRLLGHLRVPHHQAPGEAEAECARMQACGVVDAVWSDDGDTLMFGAQTLIKTCKVGNKPVEGEVQVYTAQKILEDHDMHQNSLVLFAMLSGGDYDTKGLVGCGPKAALRAARQQSGLSRRICSLSKHELSAFRSELGQCLGKIVPADFPNMKALEHYKNPVVSAVEQLQFGWDSTPIDQDKLRVFLRQRFNFWTRGFLKHIAPVLLVRTLAQTQSDQRDSNRCYAVLLKKSTKRETNEPQIELKVTFLPQEVVSIDVTTQPPEEDWEVFRDKKSGVLYEPTQRIECELLQCVLRYSLPEVVFNAPPISSARKKRKRADEQEDSAPRKIDRRSTMQAGKSTVSPKGLPTMFPSTESPIIDLCSDDEPTNTASSPLAVVSLRPLPAIDISSSVTHTGKPTGTAPSPPRDT
ncbi:hypothetical protein LTR66_003259, partial [Elasticomyces elasticus]